MPAPLVVLAVLAALAAVRFGRELLLPIALATLLSFLLSPLVLLLHRARIPRTLATAIVLLALTGAAGYGLSRLWEPVVEWAAELPDSMHRLQVILRDISDPVQRVSKATEDIAELGGDGTPVVQVKGPGIVGPVVAAARTLLVTATLSLILLFFFLSRAPSLRGKLTGISDKLLGTFAARNGEEPELAVLSAIPHQVSRYLVTITLVNAGLGTIVGFTMYLFGLSHPLLWGVMAAVLNFVPYLGAFVGVSVIGFEALITFGSVAEAVWPPLIYAVLNTTEGFLITPTVLGRRFLMSPMVVFLWLMLWTWLWGIPGALIASPLLVVLKILCEHVERLRHVASLLGR